MKTNATPLERLAILSAQRTARTDRLHEATQALLSQLEPHVQVGESVTVGGWTLAWSRYRTNVAPGNYWSFCGPNDEDPDSVWCWLEKQVDGEGYVHGDFNCSWRGPSRQQLIKFATLANQFVGALLAKLTTDNSALDSGVAHIEQAISRL